MTVLAPGPAGATSPDGVFDVVGIGRDGALREPGGLPRDAVVIADELTIEAASVVSSSGLAPGFFLSAPDGSGAPPWRRLSVVPDLGQEGPWSVRPYVPVSPLAAGDRHHGFGFTGYQLVLAGAAGAGTDPPAAAAWLTAAFHEAEVVVVCDALASSWRGRARRGQVTIDTQMDLWRLLAHASVCVDLDPGTLLARECVEALRFGTPIAVPVESGPAAVHARAGGGFTFADAEELIEGVARMQDGAERSHVAAQGRRYADAAFGDPARLVADVRALLERA
ncbi:MAG TPA: hypothetical protein VHS57_06365 [Acidimicrobiales bacterium]|nr:hypothetical protein [Acidimicrobiales bacterium]